MISTGSRSCSKLPGKSLGKEQLFTDNVDAARCVLLAQHQIPLKDFTTCRKKPENRGGLYPVWGIPLGSTRELSELELMRGHVLGVG
ncbi:hypothetical protein PPTG_22154 [Phytophthora nicotianae INRA-310]|uniref:Uncharacterized protein n=1 Tax=Phytophthora nicotianae (strain INRA-310) TaxID=761204 RepID=W2QQN4_PHYN3|nr:hypothetical protein PPTG_22154 [Phytophthora nicotianae INRA-310]ETN14570.1 hypothetical protein PPTG_22154 [Phytophthora nicotianae INRA-310]